MTSPRLAAMAASTRTEAQARLTIESGKHYAAGYRDGLRNADYQEHADPVYAAA